MKHSRLSASDELPPAICAPAAASARQAEAAGTGAADARRAGDEPAAAAAPTWRDRPDPWAPRPKPDILTAAPECGWQAARLIQRRRKAAQTAARRNPRHVKDGGFHVARTQAETAAELARQACPIEQAAIALRRRGRVIYRMSVVDGDPKLWFVAGLGRDVSDEQLVAYARKIAE